MGTSDNLTDNSRLSNTTTRHNAESKTKCTLDYFALNSTSRHTCSQTVVLQRHPKPNQSL